MRLLYLSCFAVIHAASSVFSPDILNNINARLTTTALLALTCNSIDVTVSPFHFPDRSSFMVFHSQNRKKYSKILRKILLIKYHVQFLHCDYFEPWSPIYSRDKHEQLITQEKQIRQLLKTNAHDSKHSHIIWDCSVAAKTDWPADLKNYCMKLFCKTAHQLEPFRKRIETSVNNQRAVQIDLQSSLQTHPTQKLNLLMSVPTRSKRWIYCIGWIRTMLFILFQQNTHEKNSKLIDSIECTPSRFRTSLYIPREFWVAPY